MSASPSWSAVIWGLAFVASRIALDEFSPELMTTLRFAIAALPLPVRAAAEGVMGAARSRSASRCFSASFWRRPFAIAHGVPVGLSSVIVQSQALFHHRLARRSCSANCRRGGRPIGIGVATRRLLMICGTVGYDFSVGAFAVLMISPISFAIGNLLLPARAGRAGCSICSRGCASPPRCRCSR